MQKITIVPCKPAMTLEGKNKILVVADLHIGFENDFLSYYNHTGKNTVVCEIINDLETIINNVKPNMLILLGDIKSSLNHISYSEYSDIAFFFKKIKTKIDILLIPGNHDANIQRLISNEVTLVSSMGLVIDDVLLIHGHMIPSKKLSYVDKIIMGHVHPTFFKEESIINGQRVWVSIKTDKQELFPSSSGTLEITIIPSFNKYIIPHKKFRQKYISPILKKINLTSAKIVTLDGIIIGNETMLNYVI